MSLMNQSIFLSRETAHHYYASKERRFTQLHFLAGLLASFTARRGPQLFDEKLLYISSTSQFHHFGYTEYPSLDTEECLESDIKNMPARQGLLFGCFCPIVLTHEICQNYITAISMNVEYYGGSCAKRCLGGRIYTRRRYVNGISHSSLISVQNWGQRAIEKPSQDSIVIVGIRQENTKSKAIGFLSTSSVQEQKMKLWQHQARCGYK